MQPPPITGDFNLFGLSVANLVSGAVGGILRWTVVQRTLSFRQRLGTFVAGAFVSGYGTPVIGPIVATMLAPYGVPPASVMGLTGLILGLSGQTLGEGVLKLVRKWSDNPRLPLIERSEKRGREDPGGE